MPPPVKRSKIYHAYIQHSKRKDARSMDQICSHNGNEGFSLQPQQLFLRDYLMHNEAAWKAMLVYHQIGSGKTCTAITIAEEYLAKHPKAKVTVILPARLKSNFIDELISPCGGNRYISKRSFGAYQSPDTPDYEKKRIRAKFLERIGRNYEIMSDVMFKKSIDKYPDLAVWARRFTRRRLVIIDEVHNMINSIYEEKQYEKIKTTLKIPKAVKSLRTMLLRYMTEHAHRKSKFVFLTATPVFDNISQFKELVKIMKPNVVIKDADSLKSTIGHLRGMVSFFPGTSPNAYPVTEYVTHNIEMSKTQDAILAQLQEQDKNWKMDEAFMIRQRMAAIACLPGDNDVSKQMDRVLRNIHEFAPKIERVMQVVNQSNTGKHILYSTFIDQGIRVVEHALRKSGWISLKEAKKDDALWNRHTYKVYSTWDGKVDDADKQDIKKYVNHINNIDGKFVRIILGSPSMKEGVSFKHIQHVHLLDPVWNNSAKIQVEGRAVRLCSHSEIPVGHPTLTRKVKIHIYKLMRIPDGVSLSPDEEIYDGIMPRKMAAVKAAETALKRVAIDYHLYRDLHEDREWKNVPKLSARNHNAESIINLNNINNVSMKKKVSVSDKTDTCPKRKRPPCAMGFYAKKNKHDHVCCYKIPKSGIVPVQQSPDMSTASSSDIRVNAVANVPALINAHVKHVNVKASKASSCPIPRRPIGDVCPSGFALRKNKFGIPCCYKIGRQQKLMHS